MYNRTGKMNQAMNSSIRYSLNFSTSNSTLFGRSSQDRLPAFVFCVFLVIIGTVGNCHALYIYVQRYRFEMKQRQTISNSYLIFTLSLASLDLFTCSVVLPLENIYIALPFTPFSENMCKFARYIQYVVHISSVLHIVLISIYCWRLVCYPTKRQIDWKMAIKLCWTCNVAALILSVPVIFLASHKMEIIDGQEGPKCYVEKKPDSTFIRLAFVFLSIGFFISIFIICACYVALIVSVRRTKIKVVKNTRNSMMRKNNDKTTVTLVILSIIFIISYIPFMVVAILILSIKDFKKNLSAAGFAAQKVFVRFQFINNVINPFVYGLKDEEFRQRLIRIYSCLHPHKLDIPTLNRSIEMT